MSRPLFFPLPGNEVFAERLAGPVDGECGQLTLRDFPDGESYVRLDTNPAGRDVVLVATLRHPNDETLPLVFLADAALGWWLAAAGGLVGAFAYEPLNWRALIPLAVIATTAYAPLQRLCTPATARKIASGSSR